MIPFVLKGKDWKDVKLRSRVNRDLKEGKEEETKEFLFFYK